MITIIFDQSQHVPVNIEFAREDWDFMISLIEKYQCIIQEFSTGFCPRVILVPKISIHEFSKAILEKHKNSRKTES